MVFGDVIRRTHLRPCDCDPGRPKAVRLRVVFSRTITEDSISTSRRASRTRVSRTCRVCRVSCAAVTVSLCLCTGLRGELYRGACCDNNEQDHETRTAADLVLSYNVHRVRFPVRHTEPPTRRRPPPLHAYLCSLPPGGTHPAHARAGRRHRARRGNGQTSSAARPPHVPSFTITPAHVARAHRASDPRVRSTL